MTNLSRIHDSRGASGSWIPGLAALAREMKFTCAGRTSAAAEALGMAVAREREPAPRITGAVSKWLLDPGSRCAHPGNEVLRVPDERAPLRSVWKRCGSRA